MIHLARKNRSGDRLEAASSSVPGTKDQLKVLVDRYEVEPG